VIVLERERCFTAWDNGDRVGYDTTRKRSKIKVLANAGYKRDITDDSRGRKRREISTSTDAKLLSAVREPVNVVIRIADYDESGGLVMI
jgi:hypothetical protein